MRWLCEIKKRISGELGHDVLSITQRGIRVRDLESNDGQLSMDYSKYQFVEVGDFAMNHMDLLTGYVDLSPIKGVTSPDYRVFTIRDPLTIDDSFLLFLLQMGYKNKIFYAYGQGSSQLGRWRLPTEQFQDLCFPLPPLNEQTAISDFLDQEIGKIDELIAEQERLIELLNEKRQAVISHAVTHGLDPDTPMKDSGIEWLGQIPEHWEVKRLKYISPEITVGIVVEPSKYYAEEGIPALRSLNVAPGAVKTENMVFLSVEAHDLHKKSMLRAGDLVAVRTGQPGTTAIIPPDLDGCNCIDLIIIRQPSQGCEKYLCWYLVSDFAVIQFSSGSGGAIQQHFNVSTAMDLIVPVPDREEQMLISSFIDIETVKLDNLTAEAQRAIVLLQERRSALISAAVTGQIDVRPLLDKQAA